MEEVVHVEGVRHRYPDGTEVHYRGEPLVVTRGERVVLLGRNGSGKTTLLYHLVGLLRPTEGTVQVLGVDPNREFEKVRRRIGVVLQNADEQIIAPTVRDDIAFSPRNYGVPKAEIEQRVEHLAREFEIEELLDKVPHYLSGGEKKKVALAGALAMDPELLILDEPFEGLDTTAKVELAQLLSRLHEERGISLITTTHEINLIPQFVDTVYLLGYQGRIVLKGSPREVFGHPEVLQEHHLDPPILSVLFQQLRQQGLPVGEPLTVEEAAEELARVLTPRR